MAHNTIGQTAMLLAMIKKVTAMGVSVITDNSTPSIKCLTVVIDNQVEGGLMQYPFETASGFHPSPFTWVMDETTFMRWATIATSSMYRKINKIISKIIYDMNVNDFDILRTIPNLEDVMIEMFRKEMSSAGIPFKGFNNAALRHVALIYGGVLHQERGMRMLLEDLFGMIVANRFYVNKCRSCTFHKFERDGTGHRCACPFLPAFIVDGNAITMGAGASLFPDASIDNNGHIRSRYILGHKKSCDGYCRRF